MAAVYEEIFGPVMAVLSYETIDEAVARANNTEIELCAVVAGRDIGRTQKVAFRLEAGTVWINIVLDPPVRIGKGGCKQAGIGYENRLRTLEEHMRIKGIYTSLGPILNRL